MIPAITTDAAATEVAADVARRYLPAFLTGERAPEDCYAPWVETWHAATDTWSRIGARAPSGARLRAVVPDLHHEDVRVHVHAAGFVIRATVVGTVDGHEVRVPTVLLVTVVDGRITSFEEHVDQRRAAPFLTALGVADHVAPHAPS